MSTLRVCIHGLLTASLISLTLPAQAAAQASDEAVPRVFVEALLAERTRDGTVQPTLRIGALPDRMPANFTLLEAAKVLGSVVRDKEGVVYASISQAPDPAVASYTSLLEEQGWTLQKTPRQPGFQSTDGWRAVNLCRNDSRLRVTALSRDQGGAYLRVRYDHRARGAPLCRMTERRRSRRAQMAERMAPLPALQPPEGVQSVESSGYGGGGDELRTQARATSDLSAAELVARYGKQLEDAGWTPRSKGTAADHATQSWTFEDEEGTSWCGLFVAVEAAETSRVLVFRAMQPVPEE